jgi:hypothetical protein
LLALGSNRVCWQLASLHMIIPLMAFWSCG